VSGIFGHTLFWHLGHEPGTGPRSVFDTFKETTNERIGQTGDAGTVTSNWDPVQRILRVEMSPQ